MTHDELVQKANFIFAAIKERQELSELPLEGLNGSQEANVIDYWEDARRVVAIEAQGIGEAGNADCFAIADVLLRAINRQWSETP